MEYVYFTFSKQYLYVSGITYDMMIEAFSSLETKLFCLGGEVSPCLAVGETCCYS